MSARRRYLVVALYAALLAASHIYRAVGPRDRVPSERPTVTVEAIAADGRRLDRPVSVAYRHWGDAQSLSRTSSDAIPVVLLHGSPGSSSDFAELGPALAVDRRVIAPDLPGFGASRQPVPDYSMRAHARYVEQLVDRLGVDRFHLVGFSMGGGVALRLAELLPRRTRSLTLLSAIGVQEMELLGYHDLNHAIHGLQLAGLWLLHEATPHFGAFDDAFLSVEYARNFYDSDQRPLRGILARLEMPTLVLHGDRDPLVPLAAALEHHRLVPQSRLRLFEGNHFLVFQRSAELAGPLGEFLSQVDAGAAPRRAQASALRQAEAAAGFDPAIRPPAQGFSLVVVMVLLALATLVSEDLACISAGLLAAQGLIGLAPAIVACLIGIVAGDFGLYWAGRLIGRRLLHVPPLSWTLSERRIAESTAWFERQGPWVIVASRFVPGSRLPTYFTAGLLRTGFARFAIYFLIAAAVWTPLLVGGASLIGRRALTLFESFRESVVPGLVVTAISVWLILALVRTLSTWRNRRLALGAWRRWTRWEYWPWWLFYVPIAAWIAWLSLRYRSATLFTLSNPGIELGGFVGESKGDLLVQMPADVLPGWVRLGPDEAYGDRVAELHRFLERPGGGWPVVLKPDSGERGQDVLVARSAQEAEAYLREHTAPTLLQDYVPGEEFGVFYVRRPGERRGRVTSITRKILPTVTGDGESTLERLILADERAVCQAPFFFRQLSAELDKVPGSGETVRLGDLGTHCRGALFRDANHLRSPELDREMDRIAGTIEGFYFGRFDVRTPSDDDLRSGRAVRILELNGVTSEEAHIYDPGHGVLHAWRTLASQWGVAFEIGQANRERGLEPTGFFQLVRRIRAHTRRHA